MPLTESGRRTALRKVAAGAAKDVAMTRLFAATMFTSAFLVFSLEPMVGRMILPRFGGVAAVWTTAMLFFQAMLLAGYAYAHVVTGQLGVRRGTLLHLAVVLLALATLPIVIPQDWTPPPGGHPVPRLLGYLLLSTGLPFLVACTGAPLLQKWFATMNHSQSRDPYFLYAASNFGSLAGLLSYPTLIEPNLGLTQQSWFWAAGYALLAILTGCCAFAARRSAESDAFASGLQDSESQTEAPVLVTWRTRLRWITLAFVPSSLLLGVTTYLSTDIAPIPLLWVIPLSLYLLTFIVAFGEPRPRLHRWMIWSLPLFIVVPLGLPFVHAGWASDFRIATALHLTAFTAVALVFHGELAHRRPAAARLTEFYLWIAVGGALGGVFNVVVAPIVFSTLLEYKLALILAALTMPCWHRVWSGLRGRKADVAAIGLVALITALLWWQGPSAFWKVTIPLLACALILSRPWAFGLGAALVFFGALSFVIPKGANEVYRGRSFFGTLSVLGDQEGHYRILYHGQTIHGAQMPDGPYRHVPLAYYDPAGPLGWIFAALNGDGTKKNLEQVAIIGLGTGSAAAYGRPGQEFTFFEIDPEVETVARNQFTYLNDSRASCRAILGDARLSMMQEPDRKYGLIVVDAFNSDAVPVHLLTREAIGLYRDKLTDDGVIALHITNKHLDLEPVVFAVAGTNGLVAQSCSDNTMTQAEMERGKTPSKWVILGRHKEDFRSLQGDGRWRPFCRNKVDAWTDDYSNVAGVFFLNYMSQ